VHLLQQPLVRLHSAPHLEQQHLPPLDSGDLVLRRLHPRLVHSGLQHRQRVCLGVLHHQIHRACLALRSRPLRNNNNNNSKLPDLVHSVVQLLRRKVRLVHLLPPSLGLRHLRRREAYLVALRLRGLEPPHLVACLELLHRSLVVHRGHKLRRDYLLRRLLLKQERLVRVSFHSSRLAQPMALCPSPFNVCQPSRSTRLRASRKYGLRITLRAIVEMLLKRSNRPGDSGQEHLELQHRRRRPDLAHLEVQHLLLVRLGLVQLPLPRDLVRWHLRPLEQLPLRHSVLHLAQLPLRLLAHLPPRLGLLHRHRHQRLEALVPPNRPPLACLEPHSQPQHQRDFSVLPHPRVDFLEAPQVSL
jgi:hypothetical protein